MVGGVLSGVSMNTARGNCVLIERAGDSSGGSVVACSDIDENIVKLRVDSSRGGVMVRSDFDEYIVKLDT